MSSELVDFNFWSRQLCYVNTKRKRKTKCVIEKEKEERKIEKERKIQKQNKLSRLEYVLFITKGSKGNVVNLSLNVYRKNVSLCLAIWIQFTT